MNGDGFRDLAYGDWGADSAGEKRGRAYLHYGRPTLSPVPDVELSGAEPFDRMGTSIASGR